MEPADERIVFSSAVQDSHWADVGELEQLPENVLSWFNPSQQLSTMQPLPPAASQCGEEEERKKKVKLVGWDKSSLITKVKKKNTN